MPEMDKFCSMCGEELARQKHMKDGEGDLYCMACYAAKRKVLAQEQARAGTAGATAAGDTALPLAPGIPFRDPEPEPLPPAEPAAQDSAAVWAPSIVILVASFVIMAALHFTMPEGGSISLPQAVGAGIIHSIFVALGAVILLVSLAISLRITGGASTGSFAKLLARALGLMLAVAIVDFYTGRNETLWMLLFGFRSVVMLVALLWLFELEFFDTMILSVVNMFMGWGLTFALGFALLALLSIGRPSSHDLAFDEMPVQHAMPADREINVDLDR